MNSESNISEEGALLWLERLFKFSAILAGLVLIAIMLLVSAAVFFRYVLNQPILGDQELVEIGMSLVVMLAMPYTAWKKEHIRIDIFDHALGSIGRFVCDIFARALGCFVLYLLINKTWQKTLDAIEYEDVTNMIELPVWIAYGVITAGMTLYAFVLALQLALQFKNGVSDYYE